MDRVNYLNIGLMLGALAAASIAPFHVFLFAYAILGPLHYLTEISWLHDRNYFAARDGQRRAWLALVLATTAVMLVGFITDAPPAIEIGMFYIVFIAAAVAVYVRHAVNAFALVALAAFVVALISKRPIYGIAAYLLITIIHVFIFTGAFLLYGSVKSKSRSGYLSFAVFLGCAVTALFAKMPAILPTARVEAMYDSFTQLNDLLLRLLGRDAVSIMRFIAFAYLYHYCNWFSKTNVIGWNQVSRGRAIAIVTLWLAGVALYAYDYRAGFAVFYVLSAIHVMLEFPLNHQSFAGLARSITA
jgi:hypothetical protein